MVDSPGGHHIGCHPDTVQLRWSTGVLSQNTLALRWLLKSTDASVEASLLEIALIPLCGWYPC